MDNVSIGSLIKKILISAIVLAIAAFLTPGFNIDGFKSLLLAAIVIGLLNYVITRFTGIEGTPFGRGIVGFIVAVIILLITRSIVDGFNMTNFGAIIGALVIGIVDAILPGGKKVM